MKTRFLLALLGATTLVPATAMAQAEPEARSPRGRERIERMGGEAPRARPEFRGGAGGDVRVQAPQPRPERPRADGGQWQGRPDRDNRGGWEARREQGRPNATPRREPPRDAQGQIDREQLRRDWQRGDGGDRDRRDDARRDQQRDQWQREQQGNQQRDQWQREQQGNQQRDQWQRDRQRGEWQREQQRRAVDRNRGDWNRGDGGWGRSGSDWRDNDRYRNDLNDRRQWNRNWRGDNRYDWNRYRDSNRSLYRLPRYYAPQGYGYGYRRFGVGVTLNSFLFGQNYWINDPFSYRLPDAYGPYRWVRYYNDALLVDIRSGQVVDVEYDIFW